MMTSTEGGPLWTEANFMATVPDHLKKDPDILNMAAQFRAQNQRYENLVKDVKEKEQHLKKILETLLYPQNTN